MSDDMGAIEQRGADSKIGIHRRTWANADNCILVVVQVGETPKEDSAKSSNGAV